MRRVHLFAACLAVALVPAAAAMPAFAQDSPAEAVIAAPLPVLVTSSGQALDAFTVKTLLGRAGVENTYDPVATEALLEGVGTLVIAAGASVKGFGAAGITAETEMVRTEALLNAAEAAGVTIIGIHIGGQERRGGLSEQFIQLVASRADALIVSRPGNEDGYFDTVAAERGIPLIVIDQPMQIGQVLAAQLGQS